MGRGAHVHVHVHVHVWNGKRCNAMQHDAIESSNSHEHSSNDTIRYIEWRCNSHEA